MICKSVLFAGTIAAGLGAASAAHAQSSQAYIAAAPEVRALARHDFGSDFARCAAFYGLGALLGKRDWPNLDHSDLEHAAEVGRGVAFALLGPETALAVYALALDEIKRGTQSDTNRMPIVINKFGPWCRDLFEHPETRMAHWVAVEQAGIRSAK